MDAFNFLQKGADLKDLSRFREVFRAALKAAKDLERQYIVLTCSGEYKQIDLKDIYYFESTLNHMVRVTYGNREFLFPSTLTEMEDRLRGRGFARCHNSFIVAIDAVHRVDSGGVTLNNGKSVPVSRSYRDAFKSTLERRRL